MSASAEEIWSSYAVQLGVNVRRARARLGLSQEQVAAAAGIAQFSYRKLEKGVSNPGTSSNPQLRTLAVLAEVLETPIGVLLPPDPQGIAPGRGRA